MKISIPTMASMGIAFLLFLLTPWSISGQSMAEQSERNAFSAAGNHASLSEILTVEFDGAPVIKAVEQLAAQNDLRLNFNPEINYTDKYITGSFNNQPLRHILSEILQDTGLNYLVSSSGHLVLFNDYQLEMLTGRITGRILDEETEEPIIGASVYISELEIGSGTDLDGSYELEDIPEGTYVIEISSLGYQPESTTVEIIAGQEQELIFTLEPDVADLDQLVVTGFSVRPRSIETGTLSRVEGERIRESLIQSPDQALQGRMSGVRVTGTSGQPGSAPQVRVRGLGSINAGNSPLYIVDGVQVQGGNSASYVRSNPLTGINPSDIQSIEVLKDASATALYGAQGANGVVQITTNQGQAGQTEINVSTQLGYTETPELLEVMDGPTWTETQIQGYVNFYKDRGQDPDFRRELAIDIYGDPESAPTYNWVDEMYRSGALHKMNISAASGFDNTRIFLSGGYDYEQGTVYGTDFESLRFRSNIDHDFSDRISVASRMNLTSSNASGIQHGSANIRSPFHGGYTQRPIDPIYTEDGDWNHNDWIRINVPHSLRVNDFSVATRQLSGSLTGVYNISPHLSFRSLWGLDYRTTRDTGHTSARLPRYASTGGSKTENFRSSTSMNTNQLLEYQQQFNQNSVTLMGGFEYRHYHQERIRASGENFPNPDITQLDLAAENFQAGGRTTEAKFAGFFSRAEYNYDQRYFASASLRYDGSSRFGAQNRWGLFYAGALSWDIAEEAFMDNVDILNRFRLRTSYGITGNSSIGNFASRSLFGSGGQYEGNTGFRQSGLGNDLLTWEEARTLDIGIDFAIMQDRFYGDVNWFNTRNENLLLNAWLPTDSGFSSITRNAGTVQNRGLEVELGAYWISTNDFTWSTEFNITVEQNEILELVDGVEQLGSSTIVGEPIDILVRNKFAGINPADGRPFWYDQHGEITYQRRSEDTQVLGTYSPDKYGGLTNTFSYRNLSLSTFFNFEYDKVTYNSTVGRRMHMVSTGRGLLARLEDRQWQEPGDIAEYPRPYEASSFPGSSSHNHSSVFVNDASFIRLKEVRLDYFMPVQWTQRLSIDQSNIFVQARNLHVWTNYPHGDPEFTGQGTGNYPQPKQFTVGLNLQF